jgi:hypothetical protein
MVGFPYVNWRDGLRTDVTQFKNMDDPATAGFDHHALYPENVEDPQRKGKKRKIEQTHPRPYAERA